MHPNADSCTINQWAQRHVWTSPAPSADQSALQRVYSTFLKGHFETLPFKLPIQETASGVIKAAA